MGSELKLPVIDLKNLNGPGRESVMVELHNACIDWGFFHIENHGIPHGLLDRAKEQFKEYYAKNMEPSFKDSNMALSLDKAIAEGGNGKVEGDWECGFMLMHSNHKPATPTPELTEPFKSTMKEFQEEVKALAERLLEAISENLGLEKSYIKKAMEGQGENRGPFYGTKMCHYPECPKPEMVQGLRAHTDAGGLILVLQDDEVGGLEMLKEGVWYDVEPKKHALVIDIGDMIEAISNGLYESRWHRVQAMNGRSRMSVACFYNPNPSAVIGPPPEVASKFPSSFSYPKVAFSDYMDVYSHHKFDPKLPRFQALAGTAVN